MRLFLSLLLAFGSFMSASVAQEVQKTVIILLGAPGSGKGTQASELSKVKKIPHISTGDLFRDNLKNKTELGLQAQQYLDKGQLVPDSLVLDILFDRVSQPDCKHGYVLDGVPRNITQAHELEDYFRNKTNLIVVNLAVSDDIVINRLSGRLVCRQCNRVFHKDTSPLSKPGICDSCGGEVYQRNDDKPEIIKERLKVYHDQTKPLEKFYRDKGLLKEVDASKPSPEVLQQLIQLCK